MQSRQGEEHSTQTLWVSFGYVLGGQSSAFTHAKLLKNVGGSGEAAC